MAERVIYRMKNQALVGADRAQEIGDALARISAANGDRLRPEDIVEAARDPASPLHPFFEWDDQIAAEKYRVERARFLLRHIEMRVDATNDPALAPSEPVFVRKYHSVDVSPSDAEAEDRRYVPLEVARSREDYWRQVIANAARELGYWRDKYRQYQSLAPFRGRFERVMAAIDALPQDDAALK